MEAFELGKRYKVTKSPPGSEYFREGDMVTPTPSADNMWNGKTFKSTPRVVRGTCDKELVLMSHDGEKNTGLFIHHSYLEEV